MEILNYIGRKLDNINGILRRQIELDKRLINQRNIGISYLYYKPPKNQIDFLYKRFFNYPIQCKLSSNKNEVINHIPAQFHSDLVHFLDKSKTIVTCHDIYTFLEKKNIRNNSLLQKYILSGLKKCRYIIAISEFTKNELIKRLGFPKEKIKVIKNGINKKMFYPISDEKLLKINSFYPEYFKILHVGTEETRKNFLSLLKSYYIVKKRIKKILLIRIGKPIFQDLIKKMGLEKNIIYLNGITNDRLREIYNLCNILVFPSIYEGWGAPGLESASSGLPVLCSDIPVFREIYKDFPIYFPPFNYKKLAELIIDIYKDQDLRISMRERGLEIVKIYSWEKAAEEYFKFISGLLM